MLWLEISVYELFCLCRGAFTFAVVGSLVAARHEVNKRRARQEASGVRSPYQLNWEERVQLEEYKQEMEMKERGGAKTESE